MADASARREGKRRGYGKTADNAKRTMEAISAAG